MGFPARWPFYSFWRSHENSQKASSPWRRPLFLYFLRLCLWCIGSFAEAKLRRFRKEFRIRDNFVRCTFSGNYTIHRRWKLEGTLNLFAWGYAINVTKKHKLCNGWNWPPFSCPIKQVTQWQALVRVIGVDCEPASWSSGNAFVSGAGDLRFKSRAGQIGHSVANGSPPLRHFFERSCVARAQWRGDGPRQLVTRFGVL